MPTKKNTHRLSPRNLKIYALSLGALCITASFIVGVQTAGEVHPFETSMAGSAEEASSMAMEQRGVKPGDMNNNDRHDVEDVIEILEIVNGYRKPTLRELQADPNGDFDLTVDDALRVLRSISLQ